MYPPAPDQQSSSPYTPAGVTGSTPNNNPNPSSGFSPAFQPQSQPQMGGFPPSMHPPAMSAFAPNMVEFGGMPYGTGQMPMQNDNPANQGAIQTPATQPMQGFAKGGLASAAEHMTRSHSPAAYHAQEAQKYGRGEDTVLIHMTPDEVGGLQALAKAHGGSLTTNPHTGLTEAGWLSKLLPTIFGAVLSMMGVPPPIAALIVGGGETVLSGGDLKKGFMAGLGAFGGASLAGSFGASAASNVASNAASTAAQNAAALPGTVAGAAGTAAGAAGTAAGAAGTAAGATGFAATNPVASAMAQSASKFNPAMFSTTATGTTGFNAAAFANPVANLGTAASTAAATVPTTVAPAAPNLMGKLMPESMKKFGSNFANEAGKNFSGTASAPTLTKTGLAAAGVGMPILEAMQPTYEMPMMEEDKWTDLGPKTHVPIIKRKRPPRDPNALGDTSEFMYFEDPNPYPNYVTNLVNSQQNTAVPGIASGGFIQRFGNGGSAVGDTLLPDGTSVLDTPTTVESLTEAGKALVANVKGPGADYRPGIDAEHNWHFGTTVGKYTKPPTTSDDGGSGGGTAVSGLNGVFDTLPGVISGGGTNAQNNLDTYIDNAQDRIGGDFGVAGGNSVADSSGSGFDPVTSRGDSVFSSGIDPFRSTTIQAGTGTFTPPSDPFNDYNGLGGGSGGGNSLNGLSGLNNFNGFGTSFYDDLEGINSGGRNDYARGGMTLRDGAFIIDARTVSELGNGSSGAGQELLARHGGVPIRGPGDGVSDSIRANIGGKQEARVARDEVKFDPEAVARLGNGNTSAGARKLYALMNKAHTARKSAKRGQDTGLRGIL